MHILHGDWCSDLTGTVALFRNGNGSPEWRGINIVGVYAPPSCPIEEYDRMLSEIGVQLRRAPNPGQLIMLGDFNAKSERWRS